MDTTDTITQDEQSSGVTETSPAPTDDVTAASSPQPSDDNEGSSPYQNVDEGSSLSQEEKDRAELLAHVEKAVKQEDPATDNQQEKEATPGTGAPSDPNVETGQSDDKKDATELTAEELEALKPRTRQRIETLHAQTKDLQAQLDQVSEQLGVYEPYKEFITQNDLSDEDLSLGLHAMALLRNGRYEEFLQAVGPYVQSAQEYTGRVLPPDLQQQVDEGYQTADVAHREARMRYDLANMQRENQRQQAMLSENQHVTQVQTARQAAEQWENQVRNTDPDYDKKQGTARRLLAGIRAEFERTKEPGYVLTADDAVNLTKQAYDEATELLKSFSPQPTPTNPTPSGTQSSTTKNTTKPSSMLEAAMQASRNPPQGI